MRAGIPAIPLWPCKGCLMHEELWGAVYNQYYVLTLQRVIPVLTILVSTMGCVPSLHRNPSMK